MDRFTEAQTLLVDLFLAELSRLENPNELTVNFNNTKQFDALLTHLELSLDVFPLVPSVNVLHILLTLATRCPRPLGAISRDSTGVLTTTLYMRQVNSDYDAQLCKDLLLERCARLLRRYLDSMEGDRFKCLKNLNSAFSSLFPLASRLPFARKPKEGVSVDPLVEVISDSEEDDAPINVANVQEIEIESLKSLTDLGNQVSGLGEAQYLFKSMPHLADQTPESTPEPEPKPKARGSDLARIKVYDDHLLGHLLGHDGTYDLWDLIQWTFCCAHLATQYQHLLVDAANTNAHMIYDTYHSFFEVITEYLLLERNRRKKMSKLLRLIHPLRPDVVVKSVEKVFFGLKGETHYPCFDRERLMVERDAKAEKPRFKETVPFTDERRSMLLRYRFICLLALEVPKDKLGRQIASTLASTDLKLIHELMDIYQVNDFVGKETMTEVFWEFAFALLKRLLGGTLGEPETDPHKRVKMVRKLLEDRGTLKIFLDDTIELFDELVAKWRRIIFFIKWLLLEAFAGLRAHWLGLEQEQLELTWLKDSAKLADTFIAAAIEDFCDRHSAEADVMEDDVYTIQLEDEARCEHPQLHALISTVSIEYGA